MGLAVWRVAQASARELSPNSPAMAAGPVVGAATLYTSLVWLGWSKTSLCVP